MSKTCIIVFLLIISLFSEGQNLWHFKKDTVITYYYMDGDEFSEEKVDKEKWSSWYGWARSIVSNKEQQYYSDYKHLKTKNGCLYITTESNPIQENLIDWMKETDSIKSGKGVFQGINKRNFKYQSGLIQSKKKYLRGYYEIKFKAPADKGLWPAFWLYGGSPNEEIDIMELKGEREDQTHVDSHCQGCDMVKNFIGQKKSFGGWIKLNGRLTEGFNVVSALWEENEIRYYLNGYCIAVVHVKFAQPKHIVANIAVADDNGPFHPGPDKNANSFSPFVIDYIRAWTIDQDKSTNTVLNENNDKIQSPTGINAKQHNKMLYGRKNEHLNDGVFISLMNYSNSAHKLFCNGLKKGEKYKVCIKLGDEIVFEKTTDERELELPYQIKPGLKIEITCNGKKAERMYLTR